MATIISPYNDALAILEEENIDFEALYTTDADGNVEVLSKATVTAQLRGVNALGLSIDGQKINLATIAYNAVKTVADSEKQESRTGAQNEVAAQTLAEQRVAGAMAAASMGFYDTQIDDDAMIEWRPSTADTPDPQHQLYYGRRMTYKRCRELGLGTRFGCKCSFLLLDEPEDLQTVN